MQNWADKSFTSTPEKLADQIYCVYNQLSILPGDHHRLADWRDVLVSVRPIAHCEHGEHRFLNWLPDFHSRVRHSHSSWCSAQPMIRGNSEPTVQHLIPLDKTQAAVAARLQQEWLPQSPSLCWSHKHRRRWRHHLHRNILRRSTHSRSRNHFQCNADLCEFKRTKWIDCSKHKNVSSWLDWPLQAGIQKKCLFLLNTANKDWIQDTSWHQQASNKQFLLSNCDNGYNWF